MEAWGDRPRLFPFPPEDGEQPSSGQAVGGVTQQQVDQTIDAKLVPIEERLTRQEEQSDKADALAAEIGVASWRKFKTENNYDGNLAEAVELLAKEMAVDTDTVTRLDSLQLNANDIRNRVGLQQWADFQAETGYQGNMADAIRLLATELAIDSPTPSRLDGIEERLRPLTLWEPSFQEMWNSARAGDERSERLLGEFNFQRERTNKVEDEWGRFVQRTGFFSGQSPENWVSNVEERLNALPAVTPGTFSVAELEQDPVFGAMIQRINTRFHPEYPHLDKAFRPGTGILDGDNMVMPDRVSFPNSNFLTGILESMQSREAFNERDIGTLNGLFTDLETTFNDVKKNFNDRVADIGSRVGAPVGGTGAFGSLDTFENAVTLNGAGLGGVLFRPGNLHYAVNYVGAGTHEVNMRFMGILGLMMGIRTFIRRTYARSGTTTSTVRVPDGDGNLVPMFDITVPQHEYTLVTKVDVDWDQLWGAIKTATAAMIGGDAGVVDSRNKVTELMNPRSMGGNAPLRGNLGDIRSLSSVRV
jgi:hypothetical protein